MTDNVINIDDHRPHMTAYVACLDCGKDWIAVAPADTLHFECPACSKLSGVVVDPSSPEFINAFMRTVLRILRSDLADATNPKMLEKYPHLGSPEYIEYLKREIKRMETLE